MSIISAVFIGRLGALSLSSYVLASSFYNVTGLSVVLGLCGGLDTLCGQAYGAGTYRALGLYLQRAVLICCAVFLPIAAVWLRSESLLNALGQQPDIAAGAATYLIWLAPCLFISALTECTRRYLLAQQVVKPAVAGVLGSILLAPLWHWLFINKLGWGLAGAALAFNACKLTDAAIVLSFTAVHNKKLAGSPRQTWTGFSTAAFSGWPEYLHYGIPAALMICLEWWAYEVVIIQAGWLPGAEVALSVMGICLNIVAWVYMMPMGLASAVNTRTSNALGAGNAAGARHVFQAGLIAALALQGTAATALLVAGHHLFPLFCSEPAVLQAARGVLPIIAALCFWDGLTATMSGVVRGAGRQVQGALMHAGGYWVVGLPLAWLLGFQQGWGVAGLWAGLLGGATVQGCVILSLILRCDWDAEVARAKQLVGKQVSFAH